MAGINVVAWDASTPDVSPGCPLTAGLTYAVGLVLAHGGHYAEPPAVSSPDAVPMS